MSEYAKARGIPSPKVAVAGTGVILLLGGPSMLLGVYPVVGIILLIIFLLGVSFQMHAYSRRITAGLPVIGPESKMQKSLPTNDSLS